MDELFHQTKNIMVNDIVRPSYFTKPIAFNIIPQIDRFMEDGFTKKNGKWLLKPKKSWALLLRSLPHAYVFLFLLVMPYQQILNSLKAYLFLKPAKTKINQRNTCCRQPRRVSVYNTC